MTGPLPLTSPFDASKLKNHVINEAASHGHNLGDFVPKEKLLVAKCKNCDGTVCIAVLSARNDSLSLSDEHRNIIEVYDGSAVAHRCPWTARL